MNEEQYPPVTGLSREGFIEKWLRKVEALGMQAPTGVWVESPLRLYWALCYSDICGSDLRQMSTDLVELYRGFPYTHGSSAYRYAKSVLKTPIVGNGNRGTHFLPRPVICPYCGARHNLSSNIHGGNAGPYSMSYNVCTSCSGISMYNKNLDLIPVSTEAIDKLPQQVKDRIASIQADIGSTNLKRQT